jgi:hypothetical protein
MAMNETNRDAFHDLVVTLESEGATLDPPRQVFL